MYPHADNIDYKDDLGEHNASVLKGIVIYVTDDYSGGEIVYVNKDITFKPKAGYLVCHPGSTEYTHGVNSFTGGDRIIITGFVHKRKKPN
jgi:predicted 2-oxoglutarate/Fe(II)-dependent dioxygenase YbiX